MTLGSIIFSAIYNIDYVEFLLYGLIFLSVIYSVAITFFLPTPSESKLIEMMTDKVLENADIHVIEEISYVYIVCSP